MYKLHVLYPTTELQFTCKAQQTAETPQIYEHRLWMHRKSPHHLI